jgi:hypothetical protein
LVCGMVVRRAGGAKGDKPAFLNHRRSPRRDAGTLPRPR